MKGKLQSISGTTSINDNVLKGVSMRSLFSHFKKEKPNLIILKNNGLMIEFGKAILDQGILHIGKDSINAKYEKYDRYGDMWYIWEEGSSETSEWKAKIQNTGITSEKLNYLFKIKLLDEIDVTNQATFFFGIAIGCIIGVILFSLIELSLKVM